MFHLTSHPVAALNKRIKRHGHRVTRLLRLTFMKGCLKQGTASDCDPGEFDHCIKRPCAETLTSAQFLTLHIFLIHAFRPIFAIAALTSGSIRIGITKSATSFFLGSRFAVLILGSAVLHGLRC